MSWLSRLRNKHRHNQKRINEAIRKQNGVTALLLDLLQEREKLVEDHSTRIHELERMNKELEQISWQTSQANTEAVQLEKLKNEMEEK